MCLLLLGFQLAQMMWTLCELPKHYGVKIRKQNPPRELWCLEPALALKVFEALSSEAGQQVKAKGIDMLGNTRQGRQQAKTDTRSCGMKLLDIGNSMNSEKVKEYCTARYSKLKGIISWDCLNLVLWFITYSHFEYDFEFAKKLTFKVIPCLVL